jgi:hypothetical protein
MTPMASEELLSNSLKTMGIHIATICTEPISGLSSIGALKKGLLKARIQSKVRLTGRLHLGLGT